MRCVVTGSAGFIGSHLAEELLRRGHTVVGLDAFIPYYPAHVKASNQSVVLSDPGYHFHAVDLRSDPLDDLVGDADVIFHLAAMPGLPNSWTDFDGYWTCNVQATQRLLEAVKHSAGRLRRLIYVSTSSVYGKLALGSEQSPTLPVSPYGVTKLAAEHLCRAYAESFHLPLVTLRYFSVYGPRQRPDMAYHRFFRAVLRGEAIGIHGDGTQVRGNTFVTDAVSATIAAMEAPAGETYNVGGGESATVLDVIRRIEAVTGESIHCKFLPPRPGDQQQTFADTAKLRSHLGWRPKVSLDEGLERQWKWQSECEKALFKTPIPVGAKTPPPVAAVTVP